jgi:hypothetical protein
MPRQRVNAVPKMPLISKARIDGSDFDEALGKPR